MGRPKGRKVTKLIVKWVTSKGGKKYRRYFKSGSEADTVKGVEGIRGIATKQLSILEESKSLKKAKDTLKKLGTKRKELYSILKEVRVRPGLMTLGKQNRVRSLEKRLRKISDKQMKLEALLKPGLTTHLLFK